MNKSQVGNSLHLAMIGNALPIVRRIVTEDEAVDMACIADRLCLANTTAKNEPYITEKFNPHSPAHQQLPGAVRATRNHYVFMASVPWDKLETFTGACVSMPAQAEAL